MSNQLTVTESNNVLIVSGVGPQGPAGAGGGGGGTVTSVTAGDGLLGGTITTSGTIDVNFGSAGNTVCEGNDARLSDARTPTTHSHVAADIGSVLGPGLVGRSASSSGTCERIGLGTGLGIDGSKNLTITSSFAAAAVTMTAGTGLTGGGDLSANRTFTVSYGTTASTACEGNDSRLSDARTPTAHTHALSDLTQSSATSGQVPTWNGTAWAPATPSSGGGSTIGERERWLQHFVEKPYRWNTTGSQGTVANESDAVGCWYAQTGAASASNQSAVMYTNWKAIPLDGVTSSEYQARCRIQFPNLSATSGEEGFVTIGFSDAFNASAASNGAFFRTTNGADWDAVTASGGTETATGTSVAFDSTYRVFKVLVEDVGGTLTAKFYIDGTLKATHTTNVPTGSVSYVSIVQQVVRTGSTGLNTRLNLDWVYVDIDHTDITL